MAQIDGCASLHTASTSASAEQGTSERATPAPLPLPMLPKSGAMPRSTTPAPWTAALPLRMPSAPAQPVGNWPAQLPHQGMMPFTTGIQIAQPMVMPNSPSAVQFATTFFGAAPHAATTQYSLPFYPTSQWAQGQHHTNMHQQRGQPQPHFAGTTQSSLALSSPSSLPLLQHQVQPEQPTRPTAEITLTQAELESILSPGDSPQGSSQQDGVEDGAAAAAATTAESQDVHMDSAVHMGSAVVPLAKLQDGVAAAAPAASSEGQLGETRCPAPSASDSSSCQSSTVRNELTSLHVDVDACDTPQQRHAAHGSPTRITYEIHHPLYLRRHSLDYDLMPMAGAMKRRMRQAQPWRGTISCPARIDRLRPREAGSLDISGATTHCARRR